MRPWKITVLLLLSLLLPACNSDAEKELIWEKPETHTISCDDYFSENTPDGVLYNNVWNNGAAKKFPWRQCLEKDLLDNLYGWSWVWPSEKSNVIYAYPQIKHGISPWDPSSSVKSEFPLKHSAVHSLVVEHELEVQGNSQHNIATSLWFTNNKDIGENPNPSVIVAELMIWSYATQYHMNPAGTHRGNYEVENQIWEIWTDQNWGDASGENDNKWIYITFRALNQSLNSRFDVINFTRYAIENQILPKDFYISDVELGTEIMSGSGLVWVKKFNIYLNK